MAYVILGIIVKPILVHIIVDYNLKEVIMMIVQCLLITLLSLIVPIIISRMIDVSKLVGFAVVLIVSCISVVCIVFLLGMDKKTRNTLVDLLKSKICQNEDC
jgi:hypothetical protein